MLRKRGEQGDQLHARVSTTLHPSLNKYLWTVPLIVQSFCKGTPFRARRGMALPNRMSEHCVLEQWQPLPSLTGPESVENTGEWMVSQCAASIKQGQ